MQSRAFKKTLQAWFLGLLAYVLVLQSIGAAAVLPQRFEAARLNPFAIICSSSDIRGHGASDTSSGDENSGKQTLPDCCTALCRMGDLPTGPAALPAVSGIAAGTSTAEPEVPENTLRRTPLGRAHQARAPPRAFLAPRAV